MSTTTDANDDTMTFVSVGSLIEALPDALMVVDWQGYVFLVNAQAEWLLGRSRREIVGAPVEKFIPERLRERHLAKRAEYISEPKIMCMGAEMDLFILQKSGIEVPVEMSLGPLMTENGMFVLTIVRRRKIDTSG